MLSLQGFAQGYISYFTGDTSDVTTATKGGIVLMGGATENDNAMRWFLQQSGGGDIVIIRASGSDGYNDYLFNDLGISVNSVESIVTPDFAGANTPYVAQQIRNAEALWIAGGDQADYVNFWKDGPVEDAIRYLIHTKKVVVGGTSAGMAIQGEAYFAALNGSITSAEALNDPYHIKATIGYGDFLDHPDLQNVITDTHYDNPDRSGRQLAFMARLVQDYDIRAKGIACEEYTAVCIDSAGLGRVFGGYPADNDYAYFLQVNCENADFKPETCAAGIPLLWQQNNAAVNVFKAPGYQNGSVTFNLRDWKTTGGTGGQWQFWWVYEGFQQPPVASSAPDCPLTPIQTPPSIKLSIAPNPAGPELHLTVSSGDLPVRAQLLDSSGQVLMHWFVDQTVSSQSLIGLPSGIYYLNLNAAHGRAVLPLVLQP